MEPLSSLIVQLEGAKRELREFFEKGNGAEEQKARAGNVERRSGMKELLPDLICRVKARSSLRWIRVRVVGAELSTSPRVSGRVYNSDQQG